MRGKTISRAPAHKKNQCTARIKTVFSIFSFFGVMISSTILRSCTCYFAIIFPNIIFVKRFLRDFRFLLVSAGNRRLSRYFGKVFVFYYFDVVKTCFQKVSFDLLSGRDLPVVSCGSESPQIYKRPNCSIPGTFRLSVKFLGCFYHH